MNDHIKNKIEAALAGIDGISQAEPRPFLLTRVHAAISKNIAADRSVWGSIAAVIKKPAVAFAALAVLVFVNAVAISNNSALSAGQNTAARTATAKYDFAINVSGIYDIENQEP